jgi:hypothetical protein
VKFDIVGDIERMETIATGRRVRVRSFAQKVYGKGRLMIL